MWVQLHSPPCGCTVHPSKGLRVLNDTFRLQGPPWLCHVFFPSTFFQVHGLWNSPSSGFLALPMPSSLLHETVQ